MENNFDFSWTYKDFAIRTKHQNFTNDPVDKNRPLELVKYNDREHTTCFTLAWFVLTKEGYELQFVGDRPFEYISPNDISEIWVQLMIAQKVLDLFYSLEISKD